MNRSISAIVRILGFSIATSCAIDAQTVEIADGWIDSHIHLYDMKREGFPFPPERFPKMGYPHLPEGFVELGKGSSVVGAIVVEASERREDNDWTLSLIEDHPAMLGFIGHLHFDDADFIEEVERLAQHPKFRGIRHRSHVNPPLDRPDIIEKLTALDRLGLVYESNNLNDHPAEQIAMVAERLPNLVIVVDHLGWRSLADAGDPEANLAHFAPLAKYPNVYCKLSAFYTIGGAEDPPLDYKAYLSVLTPIADTFGGDRLMFGSNWPMAERAGDFETTVKIVLDFCESREDLDTHKVMRENALNAFSIEK